MSKLPETEHIIQIAATGVREGNFTQCECFLFALTKSGRVYFTTNRDGFGLWMETEQDLIS